MTRKNFLSTLKQQQISNTYTHLDGVNYGGIADRTDYDLGRHQEYSKKNLEYLDPDTHEKYLPYVIEPSVGADRLFLSVLQMHLKNRNLKMAM